MNTPLIGLFSYLVLMTVVGVWTWGKNRTKEDGSGFAYLDTAEKGGVTLLIRQSPSQK